MTTPALFGLAECTPLGETLTLADVDELIAYVRDSRWDNHFAPAPWVLAELSRILGRDLPVTQRRIAGIEVQVIRFTRATYLELLGEARAKKKMLDEFNLPLNTSGRACGIRPAKEATP